MKFIGDYLTICTYGKSNKPMTSVCFADVMRKHQSGVDQTFTLWIVKDPNYGFKHNCIHNCLVNKDEIRKLIRDLKKIHKFSYYLSDSKYKGEKAYKLRITLNVAYRHIALFILTALRYSYEYPYNVILKEAFRLTSMPEFRFMNLFSVCNFIQSCMFDSWQGRTLHGLLHYNRSSNQSNKITFNRLNDGFEVYSAFPQTKKRLKCPLNPNSRNTLEYWTNVDEFLIRLKNYKENLKSFKV